MLKIENLTLKNRSIQKENVLCNTKDMQNEESDNKGATRGNLLLALAWRMFFFSSHLFSRAGSGWSCFTGQLASRHAPFFIPAAPDVQGNRAKEFNAVI